MKKNKLNYIGILILTIIFFLFYGISTIFLNKKNNTNLVEPIQEQEEETLSYEEELDIVTRLYNNVKNIYDAVNNQFRVDHNTEIVIDSISYKKVTNFSDLTSKYYTSNGINKYLNTMNTYFKTIDDEIYLASNLVNYQTYYFRGDKSNIYIINSEENEIEAIILEKWSSNNKETLASIKVIKEDNEWLIEDLSILENE